MNNKSIYLPALTASIIDKKDIKHKNNKSFKIFLENSIYYYPKILVSAGHQYKRDFINELGINLNKTFILGDSGGYQLVTGALKYSEEIVDKILNWLEENTTYAMNIDFPPEDKFEERLQISYINYKYFAEHKKDKTKLMNVLHGPGLERLNRWYDKIKDFDFCGGWGMGSIKGGSIFYFLQNFFFLYEKNEILKLSGKNALLHFLGFSRAREMPILLYLQHKLNQLNYNIKITFDSSYPFYTATFGNYFFSYTKSGFPALKIRSDIHKNKEIINLEANLPCNCPVCKNVNYNDLLSEYFKEGSSETSKFYLYLGTHNCYKLLEYKFNIENLLESNNKSIYESFFDESVLNMFKIIDKAFEEKESAKYILQNKQIIDRYESFFDETENTTINQFFE